MAQGCNARPQEPYRQRRGGSNGPKRHQERKGEGIVMPRRRKTIYNPRTGVTYTLRRRSTSAGKAGSIMGKRPKRRKKKGFWDSLFG